MYPILGPRSLPAKPVLPPILGACCTAQVNVYPILGPQSLPTLYVISETTQDNTTNVWLHKTHNCSEVEGRGNFGSKLPHRPPQMHQRQSRTQRCNYNVVMPNAAMPHTGLESVGLHQVGSVTRSAREHARWHRLRAYNQTPHLQRNSYASASTTYNIQVASVTCMAARPASKLGHRILQYHTSTQGVPRHQ